MFRKIALRLLLVPILVVAFVVLLVYVPPVQHMIRGRAVAFLSGRTGTKVALDRLRIGFPLSVRLEGVFLADEQGDTLLYAERIEADARLADLIRGRLFLKEVDLVGIRAHLQQDADSTFNFDFIINAFAGEDEVVEAPKDTTGGFEIDARKVHLERVRFSMELEPSALALRIDLGLLDVALDNMAIDPLRFHLNSIALQQTHIDLRTTSSAPEPSSYPALENPLADLDIQFRTIGVDDVRFTMATVNTGDSLWIALDNGSIEAREVNSSRQRIALSDVQLGGFELGMLSTTRPDAPDPSEGAPPWLDQGDGFRYWIQDWDLAIDRMQVSNSGIAFHSDSISSPALLLDPAHLVYTAVGLGARDVVANNEHVALHLDSLAFTGGSQRERVDLSAHLDATPKAISLTDGRIEAMRNGIDLRAAAAPFDLSQAYRTPTSVPVTAEVSGDLRLAELLPLLEQFGIELPSNAASQELWRTRAWIEGSLQDIREAGVILDGDEGTRFDAQGRISNVVEWPKSSYSLTLNDLVLGKGLRQLAKAFIPDDVPLPTRLTLHGKAIGTGMDANASVDLKSDLGDLKGTVEAHNWKGAVPGHIAIDMAATDIAADRLTGDTAIGPMSFTLVAKGDRLHDPDRKGSLAFTPTALSYLNNDLSHLRLSADVADDSLRSILTSDAPAASFTLRTHGPWPERGDSLVIAFDMALDSLHFQELGLTSYVLNAEGPMQGRVAWVPEARGLYMMQAPGLRVFNGERTFTFEQLNLSGLLDVDSTAIQLDCDVAKVDYHANLSVDSTLALLRERLLGAFKEPYAFQAPPAKRIELMVDLPGIERIASIVHPDLQALELNHFEGRYDSDTDSLSLNVDIPLLDYAGVEVKGLRVYLHASGPNLDGELAVLQVMRDSLHLDDLVLQATNAPGALRTSLRLRDADEDRYRIGIDLRREDDVPVMHLQEELVLDRNRWSAMPGNALYFEPTGPRAKDLALTSGQQRIELRTEDDGNHLEISGFELANITGLIRSTDSTAVIKGLLDANVLLPLRETERLKGDVAVHELNLLDIALGTVEATVEEDDKDHFSGSVRLDAGQDQAAAAFDIDLREETTRVTVDSDLDLKDLALFQPLVQTYLFDLDGALSGDLHLEQTGSSVKVLGTTAITKGRFGLVQTGAIYHIDQDSLVFDANGVALNDIVVRDTKDNRFRLDGRINGGVDKETLLDLRLSTERFQLVNSTAKDNANFYGKLFSGINLQINGAVTAPKVKGEISVLDSTNLSVVMPGSKVELVDHAGIVEFTTNLDEQASVVSRSDSEMLRDSLAAQLPGLDLDLRVKLDPNARFAVVIDPTTGDSATFRGEADLRFKYDADGDIHLQGPFTVVDGGYTVEFYGLVKKRFDLVPGGTIIWSGDPLAGRMNIQAKYSAKAAPYPLVANARGGLTESEMNTLQAPLPFDVLINIRESLQAPNITFGLDMDRQVRNSYPQVNSVLDQLAKPNNQEELNRQVFGLLVLSTFIENETGTETSGTSLATTAARNSVNSILTQQLNRLTGQGIKGMTIQLGVNTYDQSEGGESYSRTTVDYKVTQRVLNDRLSFEAGGSMGANEKRQDVSGVSNTRAPQYAIAYDLTPDGKLRLRLYHENAYDFFDGALVNNGVAIMLTREFEKNGKALDQARKDLLKQREEEQKSEKKP